MWNLFEEHLSLLDFADQICADLELPTALIQPIAHNMASQLLRYYENIVNAAKQWQNEHPEDRGPNNATEEEKHSHVPWASFTNVTHPQKLADDLVTFYRNEENKDILKPINWKVRFSDQEYVDEIVWDIGESVNSKKCNDPIEFTERTCHDLGLPLHYIPPMCAALFAEINSLFLDALGANTVNPEHDLQILQCSEGILREGAIGEASLHKLSDENVSTSLNLFTPFNESHNARRHRLDRLALEHLRTQLSSRALPLNEDGYPKQQLGKTSGRSSTVNGEALLTLPVVSEKDLCDSRDNSSVFAGKRLILERYNEKRRRETSHSEENVEVISPRELISLSDLPNRLRFHQVAIDGSLIARMRLAYMLGSDQALTASGGGYGVGDVYSLKKASDNSFSEYQRLVGAKRSRPEGSDLPLDVRKCWTQYRSAELSHAQKIILHSARRISGDAAAECISCCAPYAIMGAGAVPASLMRAIKENKQIPLSSLPKETVEKGFGIPLPGGRIVTSQGFYECRKSFKSTRRIKRIFRRRLRALEGAKARTQRSVQEKTASQESDFNTSEPTDQVKESTGHSQEVSRANDQRDEPTPECQPQESARNIVDGAAGKDGTEDESEDEESDSEISWFYSDDSSDASSESESEDEAADDDDEYVLLTPPACNNLMYSNLNSAYLSVASLCHTIGGDLRTLGVDPQAVARLATRQAKANRQNDSSSSSSVPVNNTAASGQNVSQDSTKLPDLTQRQQRVDERPSSMHEGQNTNQSRNSDSESEDEEEEVSSSASSSEGDDEVESTHKQVTLPPKLAAADNLFVSAQNKVQAIFSEVMADQSHIPTLEYGIQASRSGDGMVTLANGNTFRAEWGSEGNISPKQVFTRDISEQLPKEVLDRADSLKETLSNQWRQLSEMQQWAYQERARFMNAYVVIA